MAFEEFNNAGRGYKKDRPKAPSTVRSRRTWLKMILAVAAGRTAWEAIEFADIIQKEMEKRFP